MGVPLLNPFIGAERLEAALEVVAWLVLLATYLLATVEVQVAGVAVPCLVLVREPRVERCGFDVGGRFDHLRHDAATKHNLVIEIILYLEYFL